MLRRKSKPRAKSGIIYFPTNRAGIVQFGKAKVKTVGQRDEKKSHRGSGFVKRVSVGVV